MDSDIHLKNRVGNDNLHIIPPGLAAITSSNATHAKHCERRRANSHERASTDDKPAHKKRKVCDTVADENTDPDGRQHIARMKTKVLDSVYGRVVEHPSWRMNVLPGVCPKVMTAQHVRAIKSGRWMCAHKTDGQRIIVLIDNGVCMFFNRSFSIIQSGLVATHLNGHTVIDGELVTAKEDGANILVVHDAFCVEGISVTNLKFSLRMQVAQRLCQKLQHRLASTTYVVCKPFFDATISNIKTMNTATFGLEVNKKPFRTIKADGVVFVDDSQPAHNQRDDVVVKWKETEECTLDFQVGDDGFSLFLHQNDCMFMAGRSCKRCTPGIICEFSMLPNGEWQMIRERRDRRRPNSAASAVQTLSFKTVCKALWKELTMSVTEL